MASPTLTIAFPLRIAIAAAPRAAAGDLTLETEIRLVKAALLYADEVTLYSSTANLIGSVAGLATLDDAQKVLFLRQVAPTLQADGGREFLDGWATYQRLKRKRGKSKDELLAILGFESKIPRELNRIWQAELVPLVEQMVETSGANQLVRAINAGLLQVAPLIAGDGNYDTNALVDAFVAKLGEVLAGDAYPLFDDPTGSLVRSGLAEGVFRASPLAHDRGKQVALASTLMGALPAFPGGSVADVLDIRAELRAPLTRFRAAMVELGRLIKMVAYETDFPGQVEQVYRERVRPALDDLDEAAKESQYRRLLVGELVDDTKSLLGAGALAFGLAHATDLPALVTSAVASTAPMLHAAAKAAWERNERKRQLSRHEMFFLYQTDQLLAAREGG